MIRPLTNDTYDALMLDMPLRSAMVVDFGVDTQEHHRLLQRAVRAGGTIQELDDILGDGKKITAFVKKYVTDTKIIFKTSYDIMADNEAVEAVEVVDVKEVENAIRQLTAQDWLSEDEQKTLKELITLHKEIKENSPA